MSDLNLNDVNLVLVDHRVQLRNSLRMALNESGLHYNNIVDGSEIGTVRQSVDGSLGPDIVICDADSRGGDLFELTSAIRNNQIGLNPFLSILALSWDPTERLVRDAANSGADFLIAAPFSPKQILDRIRSLVYNRAPFVVTSDYVGPDRRDGDQRESAAPLLAVPNSLRDKIMGQFDPGLLEKRSDRRSPLSARVRWSCTPTDPPPTRRKRQTISREIPIRSIPVASIGCKSRLPTSNGAPKRPRWCRSRNFARRCRTYFDQFVSAPRMV